MPFKPKSCLCVCLSIAQRRVWSYDESNVGEDFLTEVEKWKSAN
jgi:hypothetical protein